MIKNIIKIGIPLIVTGAIFAIISISQKPLTTEDFKIKKFDFESYADQFIEDSISKEGLTKSVAKENYDRLYRIISADDSTILSTPSGKGPLVDPSTTEEYYKKSFEAYFAIFKKDADEFFQRTTWEGAKLEAIKEETADLAQRRGMDDPDNDIGKYAQYVKGYDDAMRLLRQSRYCKNGSQYESYKNQAKKFKGDPYYHNNNLKDIENKVENNAHESWKDDIEKQVKGLEATSNNSFSSIEDFLERMSKISIYEYRDIFPNENRWVEDIIERILEKRKKVINSLKAE